MINVGDYADVANILFLTHQFEYVFSLSETWAHLWRVLRCYVLIVYLNHVLHEDALSVLKGFLNPKSMQHAVYGSALT